MATEVGEQVLRTRDGYRIIMRLSYDDVTGTWVDEVRLGNRALEVVNEAPYAAPVVLTFITALGVSTSPYIVPLGTVSKRGRDITRETGFVSRNDFTLEMRLA